MGLSICRSIIDAHGGRLWAEANEPRGAVFRFILPVRKRLVNPLRGSQNKRSVQSERHETFHINFALSRQLACEGQMRPSLQAHGRTLLLE